MSPGALNRILILSAGVLFACELYAQAEQTPERLLDEPLEEVEAEEPEAGEDADEAAASREVDFNEENFRRSMELRDQALQRSPGLTTGSYSTGTGLKALDDLPEASQKHLREQLREVIVQNGPWTPEEAGEEYPYVPSPEAMKNGSLKSREEGAWGELVARYHEREASLYAATAGSQTANGEGGQSAGARSGQSGNAESGQSGNERGPEMAEGKEPGLSDQEAARAARQAALQELLDAGNDTGTDPGGGGPPMEQGVQQNALQLLTERQQLPAGAAASATAATGQEQSGEAEMSFDSEGIIAIEDLEKIDLEPGRKEEGEEND